MAVQLSEAGREGGDKEVAVARKCGLFLQPALLRRLLHTVLSLWLATLLLFGQTPKEFIHLMAHHTDTVHQNRQGIAFDAAHHHCGYLSLTLLPFDAGYQVPVCYIALRSPVYTTYQQPGDKEVVLRRARVASLRGPPAA